MIPYFKESSNQEVSSRLEKGPSMMPHRKIAEQTASACKIDSDTSVTLLLVSS